MATQKVINFDSFKRGDTPVFAFSFSVPYTGYDWSATFADFSLTKVSSPNDNSGSGVLRLNQTLTVASDGSASFEVQPTAVESKALTPGVSYKVEVQLKDGGGSNVATAISGTVGIVQDYVI